MTALTPGPGTKDQPITLGVMGGGQLGRMFVHAAQSMGFQTAVLDPDANSPAGRVSHQHVQSAYQDPAGLKDLAQRCQAITTEFENVPADALLQLAQQRWVSPGAEAVAIAQDRAAEKAHFVRCGVPVAPHALVETQADLDTVSEALLPGILKTARLGYDGKGQVRVASRQDLTQAWAKLQQQPCVLEKMLPLQAECSVIVARGHDGHMVHLPVQCNVHRDGILAVTEVHAGCLASHLAAQAIEATCAIAEGLRYVGVLCVEFFVLEGGQLVVNEMAPRPHNSGHHSINSCDVSQFELQVRTLARLPLVQPRQHSSAIMLNLLGDLWSAQAISGAGPRFLDVLALPGVHLHLYGKEEAKPGRKMGHLTLTGPDTATVQASALNACQLLGLAPLEHWRS
jgi:5-(carboxyamino)imidazole ribonucleotide synthase